MAKERNLLHSEESSGLWNNSINVVLILDNEHRFKNDPECGRIMKRMWECDLSKKDRQLLNTTRLVKKGKLSLPAQLPDNAAHACAHNTERNAISAANFKKHLQATHPAFDSPRCPPKNTCVVEALTENVKKDCPQHKVNHTLRHRILTTCGDADVKSGNQRIDPALCLCVGAHLICILDNEFLKETVTRGDGTLCHLVSMKLRENSTTCKIKKHCGRKVWTVCASDVEWTECKHVVKTDAMIQLERKRSKLSNEFDAATESARDFIRVQLNNIDSTLVRLAKTRRFQLVPEQRKVSASVKAHHLMRCKTNTVCKMTQFPVNLSNAMTVHKLMGMSKDAVVTTTWPKGNFQNWECTVLSRVRTMEGLCLLEEIDLNESFAPNAQLKAHIRRMKKMQKAFLAKRRKDMEEFCKDKTPAPDLTAE